MSGKELNEKIRNLEKLVKRIDDKNDAEQQARKYRNMLRETVFALEQTKNAFRSKQLKKLREKIQDVLENV